MRLTGLEVWRRITRGAAHLSLSLFLVACGLPPDVEAPPASLPSRASVAGVPLIEQADFFCGPASLAMVHQWAGLDLTQAEVAQASFTPGAKGTYLADMLGSVRRAGRLAVPVKGLDGVLGEVAAGNPVIVFQNLGLGIAPRWHYAVVVGYDLPRDQVILHSGQHDRMVMEVGQFARTWKRGDYWAVTVLPPDLLPATAAEWDVVSAAAALEKAEEHKAAATAYATGAKRWPENWIWQFGLGNARLALGDRPAAIRAYEAALRIKPGVPEVQNNLAEARRG